MRAETSTVRKLRMQTICALVPGLCSAKRLLLPVCMEEGEVSAAEHHDPVPKGSTSNSQASVSGVDPLPPPPSSTLLPSFPRRPCLHNTPSHHIKVSRFRDSNSYHADQHEDASDHAAWAGQPFSCETSYRTLHITLSLRRSPDANICFIQRPRPSTISQSTLPTNLPIDLHQLHPSWWARSTTQLPAMPRTRLFQLSTTRIRMLPIWRVQRVRRSL